MHKAAAAHLASEPEPPPPRVMGAISLRLLLLSCPSTGGGGWCQLGGLVSVERPGPLGGERVGVWPTCAAAAAAAAAASTCSAAMDIDVSSSSSRTHPGGRGAGAPTLLGAHRYGCGWR
jgi:hypothetical protein